MNRTVSSKFVAIDGTVCKTKEEMLEINKKVERLLLPDKIARIFGNLQFIEKADWFTVNILHQMGLNEKLKRLRNAQ